MSILVSVLAAGAAACGGSSGSDDTTATSGDTDADTDTDTGDPTDAGPDAFNLCPGQVTLTGDYIDWDSTDDQFLGVASAEVSPVDSPGDAVMTAPNGRSVLCVEGGAAVDVQFAQQDYVDLVFSALPSPVPYTVRGLATADVDAVFVDPLPAIDNATAQLLVDARLEDGTPVGAPSIAAANAGLFSRDGVGPFVAGDTGTGSYLFANVAVGDGSTTLTIGGDCDARTEVTLRAGALAFTRILCRTAP